ncbi:fimbrial biogenesis chaperone [Variovorax sp. HW608]|uniref:fimbrial biogenesis chaperone n=1 Tax=Variovorax sp. HW608 TaxID=1034889 RepID=UPI0015606CB7|nr:molecular chaperone [Variovorax sp. HW608]
MSALKPKFPGTGILLLAFLILFLVEVQAHAGVVMYGTRVIYPSEKSFVSVRLANQDKTPHLIQAWADDGSLPAEKAAPAPFVVLPPLFRLDGGAQQSVRLMFSGDVDLPADRESLYWFNFLQVPPESPAGPDVGGAQISISFLNQVKLLYRPATVKGEVHDLRDRLVFTLTRSGKDWRLTAENPTGFYANFVEAAHLRVGDESLPVDFGGAVTLAPFSSLSWRLAGGRASMAAPSLEFSLIDDSGNPRTHRKAVAVLAPDGGTNP